ncbi:MAG: lamin tail domain-containing protein [Spirochaetales bacterium]|nr:lamin tail domain-containing protein [Spirochaetales bacterium]
MESKVLFAGVFLGLLLMAFFPGCARYYDMEPVHATLKGYLFINEIFAQSDTSDDWIELYNPTNGAMDLSGFHLSDSQFEPLKWTFPDATVIAAKGFLVVKANNKDKDLQTNFYLGPSEEVVLTTPGGTTQIDFVDYAETDVPFDCSFGRSPDGSGIWIIFTNPSKGGPNIP